MRPCCYKRDNKYLESKVQLLRAKVLQLILKFIFISWENIRHIYDLFPLVLNCLDRMEK